MSGRAGRYTRVAVILHWLIAALIIANVGAALSVDYLPDLWTRPVIDTHKSIGITVLGLVILRLLWRFGHTPPAFPASYPRWERVAAHLGHGVFYVIIIALPMTGWMHDSAWKDAASHPMLWFNLFEWPRIPYILHLDPTTRESLHDAFGAWHTWSGYALYVLLAVHVGAALKHQFIDKQAEFRRMSL